MSITQEANGVSLVVETKARVYFGRLAKTNDEGKVCLRRASMAEVAAGSEREHLIRNTAKFGFAGDLDDVLLSPREVVRSRRLADVPKE